MDPVHIKNTKTHNNTTPNKRPKKQPNSSKDKSKSKRQNLESTMGAGFCKFRGPAKESPGHWAPGRQNI